MSPLLLQQSRQPSFCPGLFCRKPLNAAPYCGMRNNSYQYDQNQQDRQSHQYPQQNGQQNGHRQNGSVQSKQIRSGAEGRLSGRCAARIGSMSTVTGGSVLHDVCLLSKGWPTRAGRLMLHSLPVLYAKVNGGYVEFTAPQPRILYSFHKLAGNFTEIKFPETKYLWISSFHVARKVEKGDAPPWKSIP